MDKILRQITNHIYKAQQYHTFLSRIEKTSGIRLYGIRLGSRINRIYKKREKKVTFFLFLLNIRHAALSLMKMNLKSDKSGFMFFNEVIFGFYRNLYYKSKIFKEGLKNPKS